MTAGDMVPKRRHTILCAALVGVAAWLSAARTLGAAERPVFAILAKQRTSAFYEFVERGCVEAAADLGVQCLFVGPAVYDEAEQASILDRLVEGNATAGIGVMATGSAALAAAMTRAQAAGVPVITVDSEMPANLRALRSTFVGSSDYDIGATLARLVRAQWPAGARICIQSGYAGAVNLDERIRGFREVLSGAGGTVAPSPRLVGAGGFTEVEGCPLHAERNSGARAVEQLAALLRRAADVDVVAEIGPFAPWTGTPYDAAVSPYAELLRTGQLAIYAIDALPVQVAQIKAGLSSGQVAQDPTEMGRRAVQLLHDLAAGRPVPETNIVGLRVCLPEGAGACTPAGPDQEARSR